MLFLSPSFSSASKTQFYLHPSAMPLYPNISKDNAREQIVLMSPEKEALIKIKHCGVFFFFWCRLRNLKQFYNFHNPVLTILILLVLITIKVSAFFKAPLSTPSPIPALLIPSNPTSQYSWSWQYFPNLPYDQNNLRFLLMIHYLVLPQTENESQVPEAPWLSISFLKQSPQMIPVIRQSGKSQCKDYGLWSLTYQVSKQGFVLYYRCDYGKLFNLSLSLLIHKI